MAKLGTEINALCKLQRQLNQVSERRRMLEAQEAELKSKITAAGGTLLETFGTDDLNGATGTLGSVEVVKKAYPSVKDWGKVQAYVVKNKAWDIIGKKINEAKWRDRVAANKGKPLPGIETFNKTTLKIKLNKETE